MRKYTTLLILLLFASPAAAQRGALIEDLFRAIAEASQQNDKTPPRPDPRGTNPQFTGPQRPSRIEPGRIEPGRNETGRRQSSPAINVRSREAADFVEKLVSFSRSLDPMVGELRSAATNNPSVRTLIPEAYRVSADTRALIARCDGLASLDAISAPYAEVDARWRQLSFGLRSQDGLSSQCTGAVRSCDQLVSSMCRMLNLQPQFDRHGLHDLMIIVATHMDTLVDDLAIARVSPVVSERIGHDIRLIRGQLMKEADRIDTVTYEEVMTSFTEFVSRWSPIGESIYAINDPHLARRLDRIRECGDQTYALLWMPPPQNTKSLVASAHRLEHSLGELLDQLTIRSMVNLELREQSAVMEGSRRMFRQARELEEAAAAGTRREPLAAALIPIDKDWVVLRGIYTKIQRLDPALLAGIDHELGTLREALGVSSGSAYFDPASLMRAAAALEGSSEYFLADTRRYQRYLQPASFGQSFVAAADEVYRHAKQLHAMLAGRADVAALQPEADHLLDGWQALSQNVAQLEQRGLSSSRAGNLQRAHAEMAPAVAEITAALLGR
ncbi:hypothetical protein [Rubripirellula reticaptiva]|uniref:Uncharacterized protein n=1 Tax=Rubripirellula reticaptiva TaxID=2528013 RepID=A0A5C6ETV1_9BACT|nr:hypothetical protein [Rubripirellula reticaptiva]TWU51814.1 hypothetical protein Poly59_34090 [Rubripirellula reticaptiva]